MRAATARAETWLVCGLANSVVGVLASREEDAVLPRTEELHSSSSGSSESEEKSSSTSASVAAARGPT